MASAQIASQEIRLRQKPYSTKHTQQRMLQKYKTFIKFLLILKIIM